MLENANWSKLIRGSQLSLPRQAPLRKEYGLVLHKERHNPYDPCPAWSPLP